ncbi:hypothetical protein HUO09_16875 [Vibrio sp. Y2-5]|uniref:hypothetical protein n=1 Tax=Vibrio sp. Y2-5 TaxID=2743977 RepID=UPI00166063D4|nr:hypothetical protein [Vibrio sp. Y2-5]MBD0788029.1 hypothetical protein [Vibrio sp. Y2-5]
MRELLEFLNSMLDKVEPAKIAFIQFHANNPILASTLTVAVIVYLVYLHITYKPKKRKLWDENAAKEPYMVVLLWILVPPIVVTFKIVTVLGLILMKAWYKFEDVVLERKTHKSH